jgi:hypothetical protein
VLNPGKHKLQPLRELRATRDAARAAAADDATPPATRQQLQEEALAAEEAYASFKKEVCRESKDRRSVAGE